MRGAEGDRVIRLRRARELGVLKAIPATEGNDDASQPSHALTVVSHHSNVPRRPERGRSGAAKQTWA